MIVSIGFAIAIPKILRKLSPWMIKPITITVSRSIAEFALFLFEYNFPLSSFTSTEMNDFLLNKLIRKKKWCKLDLIPLMCSFYLLRKIAFDWVHLKITVTVLECLFVLKLERKMFFSFFFIFKFLVSFYLQTKKSLPYLFLSLKCVTSL